MQQTEWSRRGKTWRANNLKALKQLYGTNVDDPSGEKQNDLSHTSKIELEGVNLPVEKR